MHLQYLCVVYYNRAYQQGKNLSAAASLIYGTPEHARTTLEHCWAYWIQIDRRKSTIHERSVRTERQEGLLTDRLTIVFSLRKGWYPFSFRFFFHTSPAALYLLSLTSVKQSRIVGTTIFLRRSYTNPMVLESSRLAELKYAISAAWDVKKLRLSIGHLKWNFSSLKERIAMRPNREAKS